MDVRVRDRDQRPQVEDPLPALDRAGDRLRVDEVAAEDLDLLLERRVEVLEPAVVVARVVPNERPDVGAVFDQRLDQMAADEPRGSGDQVPCSRPTAVGAPRSRAPDTSGWACDLRRAGRHRSTR